MDGLVLMLVSKPKKSVKKLLIELKSLSGMDRRDSLRLKNSRMDLLISSTKSSPELNQVLLPSSVVEIPLTLSNLSKELTKKFPMFPQVVELP